MGIGMIIGNHSPELSPTRPDGSTIPETLAELSSLDVGTNNSASGSGRGLTRYVRPSENGILDSTACGDGVACGHGIYRRSCSVQALLLPASVEDYVAADNPVRFIETFVDALIWAVPTSCGLNRRRRGGPATIRPICSSCTFTAISTGCGRAGAWRRSYTQSRADLAAARGTAGLPDYRRFPPR
jgi:hypothetical protein